MTSTQFLFFIIQCVHYVHVWLNVGPGAPGAPLVVVALSNSMDPAANPVPLPTSI